MSQVLLSAAQIRRIYDNLGVRGELGELNFTNDIIPTFELTSVVFQEIFSGRAAAIHVGNDTTTAFTVVDAGEYEIQWTLSMTGTTLQLGNATASISAGFSIAQKIAEIVFQQSAVAVAHQDSMVGKTRLEMAANDFVRFDTVASAGEVRASYTMNIVRIR